MAEIKHIPADHVTEEFEVGFGVDEHRQKVIMQFDRHVRAVGFSMEQTVELIEKLCKMLNELGVAVSRDGRDDRDRKH